MIIMEDGMGIIPARGRTLVYFKLGVGEEFVMAFTPILNF